MTTKQEINSYGDGITVNSTVCLLDDKRGGIYMRYHSIIWLIAVPLGIILVFYTFLSFMACFHGCKCNPDEEIHIHRHPGNCTPRSDINWLITVILFVLIYIICYAPYELSNIVIQFFNKPPTKMGVMIVFFLYYAPPAVLPIVLGTINVIVRESYYRHLFFVKAQAPSVEAESDKDDIISNQTCNSTASSMCVKSQSAACAVSLSACSDPDFEQCDFADENTRIIQRNGDSDTSNSTSYSNEDTWSPQVHSKKRKAKEKSQSIKSLGSDDIEEIDNDEKPMLVTSV